MRDKASRLSTTLQITDLVHRPRRRRDRQDVKTNLELGMREEVTTSATIKAEVDLLYPT
jgi:hypothetical protein